VIFDCNRELFNQINNATSPAIEADKMTNNNEKAIIAAILDCGFGDVEFLIKELENFDIDFTDLWDRAKELFESQKTPFNGLIGEIYQMAITGCEIDEEANEVVIFTNSIDSHIYINGEEYYDIAGLKEFAESQKNESLK